jgi:hypothetical protein
MIVDTNGRNTAMATSTAMDWIEAGAMTVMSCSLLEDGSEDNDDSTAMATSTTMGCVSRSGLADCDRPTVSITTVKISVLTRHTVS